MFDKIECIEEIGLFKNYKAKGDVSLKKMNLIYGENGTGKTTLSHIFRSLTTGNSKYINIKKEKNAGHIELRKVDDTKKIVFNKDSWSETIPNIEIFDSTFIEDNIHSGYAVTNNHKKKMVNLILGEDAVSKNNEFNAYKKQQDEYEQELKTKFAEIKADKDFMASQKDPYNFFISKKAIPSNIDEIIEKQIIKIKNLEMRDSILKYQNLSEITKPGGDVLKLKEVLMKTIDGITSNVEQLVKSHISQFSNLDETWIEKGLGAITENKDRCPFCGSDIKELSLIKTYSIYFNKEYLLLKEKIMSYKTLSTFIKSNYTKRAEMLESNKKIWDSLWKELIKEEFEYHDFKDIDTLTKSLDDLVARKEKSLLEAINENDVDFFIELYNELMNFYEKTNNYIKDMNFKIKNFKNNLGEGNLVKEKQHLIDLQITAYQRSLLEDIKWKRCVELCNNIVKLKQNTIPKCKKELDALIENNCETHQKNINSLLKRMNAKFSLEMDKKLSYITKEANYNYYIKIDDRRIPIKSDDNDSFASPCLGNCLSEGDKTSLAFAFFLSKLDLCSDLAEKIIIFDDPISSLDEHRRIQTISFIVRYAAKALSCFVFSHDAYFLKKLYKTKTLKSNEVKMLEICYTIAEGSVISECDIYEKTKSQFVKDFECLKNYKGGTDLKAARAIRTYLEGLLRRIAPDEFKEGKWLGDYIELIRNNSSHYLYKLLQEISDINDYAKEFHHDTCTDEVCSVVNEQQLKGFIDRAIGLRKSIFN